MAEKDEKNLEEEKETKKKKSPVMIIILAVLFIFLFGGGFFVWQGGFLDKSSLDKSSEDEKEPEENVQQDIGPMYPLDTFIVNLIDPQGKKYLKSKIELELESEEVLIEIDKRLPQFRDTILTLLSNKSYDDISGLEGKFQLRLEIMAMLNQHLKTGEIMNIYFTEFIVQ